MGLKHLFHSAKADPADPTIIGATKWNADHYYVDGAGAPIGNVGALLLAGAAGALTHLNSVAAGSVLTSAGAGALPVWAAPSGGGGGAHAATHAAGGSDPLTGALGSLDVGGVTLASGNVIIPPDNLFAWSARAVMKASADGMITFYNAAQNNFGRLQFGGTTNAFPALRRTGAQFEIVTADGSAYSGLLASRIGLTTNGGDIGYLITGLGPPEGVVAAGMGSLYLNFAGGASTTLYVKQGGAATNTGWVAK